MWPVPQHIQITTTDTAAVSGATFSNGTLANDVSDSADTLIIPEGAIGDTIFFDVNQNGRQDENEPGIAGAVVELYENDGVTLVASTTTDSEGNYSFGGLADGTYRVIVDGADVDFPAAITQTYEVDSPIR